MAQQGSGVVAKTIDPAMAGQTSYDARSGAAKHPQTSFPIKWGMTNQTAQGPQIGPVNPGSGPDASSPNPLDPESQVRVLRKQPDTMTSSWGMKDANGNGVDNSMAGKVLGSAILSGSSRLPATATPASGPGPSRGV